MTISMNDEKLVVDATNNVEDIPKNSDGNDTHQVDVEEGSNEQAFESVAVLFHVLSYSSRAGLTQDGTQDGKTWKLKIIFYF